MKTESLIKILSKPEFKDLNIVIYVPGDDVGYWNIEKESQIAIDEYTDTKEKFVKLTIY